MGQTETPFDEQRPDAVHLREFPPPCSRAPERASFGRSPTTTRCFDRRPRTPSGACSPRESSPIRASGPRATDSHPRPSARPRCRTPCHPPSPSTTCVAPPEQPVAKVPAAFERRCIPPDCVAPRSNMPNILPRRALSGGHLAALGATRGFTTGCEGLLRRSPKPGRRQCRVRTPPSCKPPHHGLIRVTLHVVPDPHPSISRKCCSPSGKCSSRAFTSSTLG